MDYAKQFQSKVVLVTGAGTGMGAETAFLLAQRGANVSLIGRREQPLLDVARRIESAGGNALVIPADVADAAQADRVVQATVGHFGALHHAVNNAGIAGENFDVTELSTDLWDHTIAVNLSSVFFGMRAQLRAIEQSGGGAIVNVSSVFADRGLPMRAAYTASKHGIRGITRSAALDWAARGVRINELQPGVIDTPMIDSGGEDEVAQISKRIPVGRMGTGREIATGVAFLLSDEASYITGAHLSVDGGFLA